MTEEPGSMANDDRYRMIWVVPASLQPTLHSNAFNEPARELGRLGWEVSLLAQGNAGDIVAGGFSVRYLPMPRVYLLGQMIYHLYVCADVVRHWKVADVVFFHQESALWMWLLRPLRWIIPGCFPLLIMDTRTVEMSVATPKARLRDFYRRLMNLLANHLADGQTAITGRLAEAVGISPAQLLGIWPSGANRELFSQAIGMRRWPVESEPLPLMYIGTLTRERNVLAFCRAVVAACERGMNFTLTIIGSGDERPELEAFAEGSGGRVRVLAPVPHDQVPKALAQACVGVLPFPDEEKFRISSPIKLMEYLAAGMPILATRIVCHTDVVGDLPIAVWADGSDEAAFLRALEHCWNLRDRLPAMGQAASEAAVDWTWAASARKISDALRLALGRIRPC